MPDSNTVHMEVIQYQPAINKEIWSHDATTIEQCKPVSYTHLDVYKRQVPTPLNGGSVVSPLLTYSLYRALADLIISC